MTDAELLQLKQSCHSIFSGHALLSPADSFSRMAQWCAQQQVQHDVYGEGEFIQTFETKIASLLGMEAAVFCMTGTLAQVTALRLACTERGSPLVALHPTSHILLHERSNFQALGHFTALQIGNPHHPWDVTDLQKQAEKIAAAQYELPMREIGGQLPDWDSLEAIKSYCHTQNIHLHMDGARLWEASAGLNKSLPEIAAGFDSVYVSFYKGIGGMGGAMLLGNKNLIAKARVWMHRQGGNVFRRTPYVVAAAMQFDQQLAQMPAYLARTRDVFRILQDYPEFRTNPAAPQVNMFHLHLPVDKDTAIQLRNQIAAEHGIWLFNQAVHASLPNYSMFEWYVGDQLLHLSDTVIRQGLDRLRSGIQQRNF